MEAGMSAPVALRDAPSLFLDPGKWAELRSFASNDLIALTYVNAQYLDKNDLFWREGSFEEALHCVAPYPLCGTALSHSPTPLLGARHDFVNYGALSVGIIIDVIPLSQS